MIKFVPPTTRHEKAGMTPQEYCEDKAAQSGSSFYYSFLSLPDNKRKAIIALYAFCREVDDIVDQSTEPQVKAAKLDWWREEIERLFERSPQHPISQALLPVINEFNLPKDEFLEILNGMAMDLQSVRFDSFKQLKQYCYRVAGVVGILSARIFGFRNADTLKYAHDLGIAFQLTNIIRDVFEDIMRGRLYLPQDEMQQFGVTEQDLYNKNQSDEFHALMQFQAERAKQYYQRAFSLLPQEDRFLQRAGIIMAAIYESLLDEIILDDFRVLEHRLELTSLRKLWIVWKTRRLENKKYRQWLRQSRHG